MSFWDRIEIGAVQPLGSHLFTADSIREFAAKYDAQPFHLDEEAAKRSVLGGLCASGWHTAAAFMRLYAEQMMAEAAQWAAAGNAAPVIGPSPGVRNLRWLRPVYAGETVSFTRTVASKRESKSRPGWGVIETANEGTNTAGQVVFGVEIVGLVSVN